MTQDLWKPDRPLLHLSDYGLLELVKRWKQQYQEQKAKGQFNCRPSDGIPESLADFDYAVPLVKAAPLLHTRSDVLSKKLKRLGLTVHTFGRKDWAELADLLLVYPEFRRLLRDNFPKIIEG